MEGSEIIEQQKVAIVNGQESFTGRCFKYAFWPSDTKNVKIFELVEKNIKTGKINGPW